MSLCQNCVQLVISTVSNVSRGKNIYTEAHFLPLKVMLTHVKKTTLHNLRSFSLHHDDVTTTDH